MDGRTGVSDNLNVAKRNGHICALLHLVFGEARKRKDTRSVWEKFSPC